LLWKDGSRLNKKLEKIKSLVKCWKIKSKNEFDVWIKDSIKNIIAESFNKVFEKSTEKDKSKYLYELRYGDHQGNRLIKDLLVLFDILSFHKDELYPFRNLRNIDIEHVHALRLNDEDKKNIIQDKTEILNGIRGFLGGNNEFNELLENESNMMADIEGLINSINGKLELNGINNLTLLPESVNRGIKNAKFADKRKAVITLLKENTYIYRSA
jgi:hypothetical protein